MEALSLQSNGFCTCAPTQGFTKGPQSSQAGWGPFVGSMQHNLCTCQQESCSKWCHGSLSKWQRQLSRHINGGLLSEQTQRSCMAVRRLQHHAPPRNSHHGVSCNPTVFATTRSWLVCKHGLSTPSILHHIAAGSAAAGNINNCLSGFHSMW